MGAITEQTIDFADTAPFQAEGTAVAAATPEQIWAVLTDHETWPSWFGTSLKVVKVTSDPATGVGSTRDVTLQGGVTVSERFIVWEENRRWAFTGTAVTMPVLKRLVERCVLEPVDDTHTRITYRMAAELAGPMKPLGKLMQKTVSKALTEAMGNLGAEAIRRAAAGEG